MLFSVMVRLLAVSAVAAWILGVVTLFAHHPLETKIAYAAGSFITGLVLCALRMALIMLERIDRRVAALPHDQQKIGMIAAAEAAAKRDAANDNDDSDNIKNGGDESAG